MTDIKRQLEKFIELNARVEQNEFYSKVDRSRTFDDIPNAFKAGAHSILPMLLVAIECLNKYKHAAFELDGKVYKVGSQADEALSEIKAMITQK